MQPNVESTLVSMQLNVESTFVSVQPNVENRLIMCVYCSINRRKGSQLLQFLKIYVYLCR